MFTGIIKYTGTVTSRTGSSISVRVNAELGEDLRPGDSISVSGVCLTLKNTVNSRNKPVLSFDVSPGTAEKTVLKNIRPGEYVNIEPPLKAQDFLSGHIVTGHVGDKLHILEIKKQGDFTQFALELKAGIRAGIFDESSVALDGVSLTVSSVDLDRNVFFVSVIPETMKRTNLGFKKKGDFLNVETDYLLKKEAPEKEEKKPRISFGYLAEKGFL